MNTANACTFEDITRWRPIPELNVDSYKGPFILRNGDLEEIVTSERSDGLRGIHYDGLDIHKREHYCFRGVISPGLIQTYPTRKTACHPVLFTEQILVPEGVQA